MIEHATWSPDNDVAPLAELVDLRADRLASVDGETACLATLGELDNFVAYLNGQFARRYQYQGTWLSPFFGLKLFEDRNCEGGSFPVPVRAWPITSVPVNAKGMIPA